MAATFTFAPPRARARRQPPPDSEGWLRTLYPSYLQYPFADYHREFWDWVWAIEHGQRPDPFVAIWPRSTGKSTSAELACVAAGARKTRSYALYVCGTQDQADAHVATISELLANSDDFYPDLARRKLSKYGSSMGWRRNRLWTAHGFIVDALGLDTAARGIKLGAVRPDFIILDDVDDTLDSPSTVNRKIAEITRKIIPAGSQDVAILAVQNLIHGEGFFAQMVSGEADYLTTRILSGPHPAVRNLQSVDGPSGGSILSGGEPTWEGLPLERCQEIVNAIGLTAFRAEYQHDVSILEGSIFGHVQFRRAPAPPDLVRTSVWVDPAVTDKDQSDSQAVSCGGIASNGDIYFLQGWERRASPKEAIMVALDMATFYGAQHVGIETDQGGDTWRSVFNEALRSYNKLRADHKLPPTRVGMRQAKAGAGFGPKAHRASQMLTDYETGRILHVTAGGRNEPIEQALRRFPVRKPFDLVDSWFWTWHDLRKPHGTPRFSAIPRQRLLGPVSTRPTLKEAIARRKRQRDKAKVVSDDS